MGATEGRLRGRELAMRLRGRQLAWLFVAEGLVGGEGWRGLLYVPPGLNARVALRPNRAEVACGNTIYYIQIINKIARLFKIRPKL